MSYIKNLNELNPKNFKIGQIVFYLDPNKASWDFGKIVDYYSDGYGIELYEFIDDRLIDDVPIAEYKFNVKRPLPKKWSYDTKFFKLSNDERIHERAKKLGQCTNYAPENIQKYIDVGLLVKPSTQHLAYGVYSEINDDKTYSIVLREVDHPKTDYVCVNTYCVFSTLEEVLNIIKRNKAEKERKANLSDYDTSIEEMNNVLKRYEKIYQVNHNKIADIRKTLMEILNKTSDGIVDIRIYQKEIQYIAGNGDKKWKNLNI